MSANALSRSWMMDTDWSLDPLSLCPVFDKFRHPSVDAFASPQNAKCPVFFSRTRPSASSFSDVFTHCWMGTLFYMFPLFSLISHVLQKITTDGTTCILVTLWWPCQQWFAVFLQLSWGRYYHFPPAPDLLSKMDGRILHPNPTLLKLTAWFLCP